MDIKNIQEKYGTLPQCAALAKLQEDKSTKTIFLQGLIASAAPLFFAAMAKKKPHTYLFILPDADSAGYFYHDLTQIMGRDNVFFFPSSYRRAVKYGQRDAANEILRTEVLAKLNEECRMKNEESAGASNEERRMKNKESANASPSQSNNSSFFVLHSSFLIVSHPEAIAELVVSKKNLDERIIKLSVGDTADIVSITHTLREFGFQETDYVYEPGQFAVRGSILDVFSFSCEYPFRIDFFGDDIDTIRTFEVQDQLSKDKKTTVEIVPELAKVNTEKIPFLHFLPTDATIVTKDFTNVYDTIKQVYDEGFSSQAMVERLEGATEMEQAQIKREMERDCQLYPAHQFANDALSFRRIEFGQHATGKPQATIPFHISAQPLFHKNIELLKGSLETFLLQEYQLYILADSQKQQQRLRDIFDERGATDGYMDLSSQEKANASTINFIPIDKTLHEGFVDHDLHACFFTDHQIFDRFHKYNLKSDRARAGKMALTMKEIQEMEYGDFLVHVDYGIGKFGGLLRIPNGNGFQEVIRIIYQHNDKVDVSIHSLYKISKYRRSDTGEPPRLSILGSGAWDRLKERTKKRIKDIARDLIKLYAKRRHEKGFAFTPDSYLQHELEASFLYEDTPDQLKATQEVKADMENSRPMDRLVCGDVGFGKTEVAIRAAFKAACDSKQVAVLVPTTVLAFQHYQTFCERLKNLPVRVEYLSRARTAAQTRQILTDLETGKVDIIVGTHKLIGKNVKWHDLGLLIIDEEQKFGVSTKEKLRQLKSNIDTLTMSATPIPRTLQFSLMGARDMSIIRTPPPNRHPIHTELGTYGSEIITDAINFEMSRNGQVFFVNNRISNLPEIERLILKYIPDCRIAIGHGQMKPEELEKIIMGFINYDYDVLLSTTIVENGIDIPNANTIIINNAHQFGLSDLHQMRGRVGRSNRKAFCYLLSPPISYLTPEARRRLEALETFSDLGSGFNLAMQDLDIRGAGNLLGAEQSGFMEDLGYETYQKVLSQAITELKNDEFGDMFADEIAQGKKVMGDSFIDDCTIESDLPMYFPETYVPGSAERMLLYRELDNIENDRELDAYRQRLIDRFGPVPTEGEELMQVVALRRIGKRLGCEKIIMRQGKMIIQFVSNSQSAYYQSAAFEKMLTYIASHTRRCDLKEVKGRRLMHINQIPSVSEAVNVMRTIESV
ncbi:MAG: transcription-repair coupling factor [Prevotella sp.]|nr:transcription-repair coupling factor [Prevotella sp.]